MASIQHDKSKDLDLKDIPPFPGDVPTVPLLRISLDKLVHNDDTEISRMWQACQEIGFFYLDLSSTSTSPVPSQHKRDSAHDQAIYGPSLLNDADSLFTLGSQFFSLPVTEKQKYDYKSIGSYFGYKGFGAAVIDSQGTPDRNEFYNTSKDFVLGIREALPEPELLMEEQSRAMLRSFIEQSHAVVALLLDVLNKKLGLPEGKLASLHRLHAVSGDQVRWVKSPSQPEDDRKKALGEHTDFGSVTLLFNRLGGLQVLPPDQSEWAYVRPLQGHCVVNLGDALVKFSAGLLRSNLHRVVNPPGPQANETRMSLVYFARPEDEVMLKALDGSSMIAEAKQHLGEEEEINARDWISRRALGRRAGGNFAQSGGTERKP